jgi:phosphohistidine phosphatase
MHLYFIRHGLAQDNTGGTLPDALRALVPKGERRAEQTGRALRHLGIAPARLYTSPLVRARQTADRIGEALGVLADVRQELDFTFNPAAVDVLIADAGRDDHLLFVGHEPGMSETVGHLIGGGAVEMKKGAVACVEVTQYHPARGVLRWLLPAGLLETLSTGR